MNEFRDGITVGFLVGACCMFVFFIGCQNFINIETSPDYQTIDVVKIYRFSDGSQYVKTSGYAAILGFRIADNVTYSDPHHYITNLGKNEVKTNARTIDSVLTTIKEVST